MIHDRTARDVGLGAGDAAAAGAVGGDARPDRPVRRPRARRPQLPGPQPGLREPARTRLGRELAAEVARLRVTATAGRHARAGPISPRCWPSGTGGRPGASCADRAATAAVWPELDRLTGADQPPPNMIRAWRRRRRTQRRRPPHQQPAALRRRHRRRHPRGDTDRMHRTRVYRDGALEAENFPVAEVSDYPRIPPPPSGSTSANRPRPTSARSARNSACTRSPSRTRSTNTSGRSSTTTRATCS